MEKNHAPPIQATPAEMTAEQKQSRAEAIIQALRNLRWRLGNAALNANKGIANKH